MKGFFCGKFSILGDFLLKNSVKYSLKKKIVPKKIEKLLKNLHVFTHCSSSHDIKGFK